MIINRKRGFYISVCVGKRKLSRSVLWHHFNSGITQRVRCFKRKLSILHVRRVTFMLCCIKAYPKTYASVTIHHKRMLCIILDNIVVVLIRLGNSLFNFIFFRLRKNNFLTLKTHVNLGFLGVCFCRNNTYIQRFYFAVGQKGVETIINMSKVTIYTSNIIVPKTRKSRTCPCNIHFTIWFSNNYAA